MFEDISVNVKYTRRTQTSCIFIGFGHWQEDRAPRGSPEPVASSTAPWWERWFHLGSLSGNNLFPSPSREWWGHWYPKRTPKAYILAIIRLSVQWNQHKLVLFPIPQEDWKIGTNKQRERTCCQRANYLKCWVQRDVAAGDLSSEQYDFKVGRFTVDTIAEVVGQLNWGTRSLLSTCATFRYPGFKERYHFCKMGGHV